LRPVSVATRSRKDGEQRRRRFVGDQRGKVSPAAFEDRRRRDYGDSAFYCHKPGKLLSGNDGSPRSSRRPLLAPSHSPARRQNALPP
jgi:hypothetical protein